MHKNKTQTKKRILRKKSNRKTKNIKRNKTRKYIGGTIENDNHVFVGFYSTTPTSHGRIEKIYGFNIPIILSKNNQEINRMLPWPVSTGPPQFIRSHIIIPYLYKLKNYRGLDLADLAAKKYVTFRDENEIPYFTHIEPPTSSDNFVFLNHQIPAWVRENKDKIKEVELKFPTLFKRIYVSEEEEKQALQEIEKIEQEKAQPIPVQELSAQQFVSDEDDEKKQAVYRSEIEVTNQMIPYLRAEAKKKKLAKIARKLEN